MKSKIKNYQNEELRAKLVQTIGGETYGDFNGIVIDVFLRRAYEFNLPEKQILQEAIAFKNSTGEIRFSTEQESEGANWSGVSYSPQNGQKGYILINKQYYDRYLKGATKNAEDLIYRDMYETVAHEVFHGIAYHRGGTALINAYQNGDENRRNK